MRIIATLLGLALIPFIGLAASGAPSLAGDRVTKTANRTCIWRGTAPFCKGECEAGEVLFATAASPEGAKPNELGFGKSCASGRKFYCCVLECLDGWTLSANDCVRACPEGFVVSNNQCVPREPSAETMKKGPIAVPTPYETYKQVPTAPPEAPFETKRNTGPLTKE